ncbi:DUF2459 domain-containing protein [Chlorogloeopsis sp. ULAP01]|uniref:DUF2459 domain-containing protein n=1 Tax=Chlorogloeopsis sp. ULAP01 TaxID=3056483 RepID=UPI0025AB1621|nr:DUF2459 domain-containing protein [Chlorogloeopsis sp. ULAP01]MDM9383875.1 DUF2459 domain-containing protein [Chlorogloeopsis sp. ULAP01]
MHIRRIITFTLIAVTCVFLIWIFTPASIIPPARPTAALTVHVLDLGLHPELVLPDNNGELIVYAYGDWNYFALNNQGFTDGLAALLIPTQGTLGRQKYSNIEQLQQTVKEKDLTLLSFKVAKAKALQLSQTLDQRFNRNINTHIENPQTGLTLVKDEQEYTMLHNSNHELVEWLEQLDCQVEGFVMWSNFQVKYRD